MSSKTKVPAKVLPLAEMLRDLAVLRASGVEIPKTLLQSVDPSRSADSSAADSSVDTSYEFIRAARAAIKLNDSGKVESEGGKIGDLRAKYEDLLEGLDAGK